MGEAGRIGIFDFTDQFAPGLRGNEVEIPCLIHDGEMQSIGLAIHSAMYDPICLWMANDQWNWGPLDKLASSVFGAAVTPFISADRVNW